VNKLPLEKGDVVAVEASPGHDIGTVTMTGRLVPLQVKKANLKPGTELKKIYRKARQTDIDKWNEAKKREQIAKKETEAQKKELNQTHAAALGVSEEEAQYLWSEHVATSNTYSEKADSIDILYSDGRVRDIAEASEILDLEALTRKPIKRYIFKYRI
jgi:cell fate regulator YaaT (PSP1 superfamily)